MALREQPGLLILFLQSQADRLDKRDEDARQSLRCRRLPPPTRVDPSWRLANQPTRSRTAVADQRTTMSLQQGAPVESAEVADRNLQGA